MHLFIAMSPKYYYFQLGTTPDLDAAYQKLKREKLVLTHYTENLSTPEADYFFDRVYECYDFDSLGWSRTPIWKFLNGQPDFIMYIPNDTTYDPVEKYLRDYPDAYLTGASFVGRKLKQPTLLVNKNWRFRLLKPDY